MNLLKIRKRWPTHLLTTSNQEMLAHLKRIPISVKFVQFVELKDLLSKLKTVWSKGLGQRWANNVFGTKYEWYTGIQRMFSFWKWLNLLQIMFKLKAIFGNILNMNDIENTINFLLKRNNISTYCNSKNFAQLWFLTPTFQYQVKCIIVRTCKTYRLSVKYV